MPYVPPPLLPFYNMLSSAIPKNGGNGCSGKIYLYFFVSQWRRQSFFRMKISEIRNCSQKLQQAHSNNRMEDTKKSHFLSLLERKQASLL